jgi:hypothetical protein
MTIDHVGNNIYLVNDADDIDTNLVDVPVGAIAITRDTRRFYIRDADSWDELAYASTGSSDVKTVVNSAGAVVGAGLGREINLPQDTVLGVTEDIGNDAYDIEILDDGITDSLIDAHTSTKITITDKTHLPATAVYTDQANTFAFENIHATEQRHNRIVTTPANPPADTGLTYLLTLDANNDVFASKSKIGGSFTEVRDF